MRDKEAVEAERKNISRHSEKQTKVMEKLVESEKSLAQQVVSGKSSWFHDLLYPNVFYPKAALEKEVVLWRRGTDELKKKLQFMEMQTTEWQYRAEQERERFAEVNEHFPIAHTSQSLIDLLNLLLLIKMVTHSFEIISNISTAY